MLYLLSYTYSLFLSWTLCWLSLNHFFKESRHKFVSRNLKSNTKRPFILYQHHLNLFMLYPEQPPSLVFPSLSLSFLIYLWFLHSFSTTVFRQSKSSLSFFNLSLSKELSGGRKPPPKSYLLKAIKVFCERERERVFPSSKEFCLCFFFFCRGAFFPLFHTRNRERGMKIRESNLSACHT